MSIVYDEDQDRHIDTDYEELEEQINGLVELAKMGTKIKEIRKIIKNENKNTKLDK